MKLHLYFAIFLSTILFSSCTEEKKTAPLKTSQIEDEHAQLNIAPEGFELLFNGTDFNGWHMVTNGKASDGDLFLVEKGIVHAYPNQKENSEQPFGALITDAEYENYTLSLEYKWGEKKFSPRNESVRDAGLCFHVFDEDLFWPSGAECQIQEGDTGDLWLIGVRGSTKVDPNDYHYSVKGELLTKGGEKDKRYQSFARSFFWEKNGWNKIIIEVKGASAKFTVNGKLVNEALNLERLDQKNENWLPLTKGKILLQAEGAEIFYRNVYIKKPTK